MSKFPKPVRGGTRESQALRAEVLRRYGGIGIATCYMCGVLVTDHDKTLDTHYNADHVIPLIAGGESTIQNVKPACAGCNQRKSMIDAGEAALAKRRLEIGKLSVEHDAYCKYHGSRCGGPHSEVGAALYDHMFEGGSFDKFAAALGRK